MTFRVQIYRNADPRRAYDGYVHRTIEVEANHGAHARAVAEQQLQPGETIPARAGAVRLASQRIVDPTPTMGPDHARNVATGGRS